MHPLRAIPISQAIVNQEHLRRKGSGGERCKARKRLLIHGCSSTTYLLRVSISQQQVRSLDVSVNIFFRVNEFKCL